MALQITIELSNGIVTNYHRIASLNKIVNMKNVIEINSYTKKEKRDEEKTAYEKTVETGIATPMDVFIGAKYLEIPYDEEMTIEQAYNYLKTLEEFKGAVDI